MINNLETKIKIKDKKIEPSKEIVEYLEEAKNILEISKLKILIQKLKKENF